MKRHKLIVCCGEDELIPEEIVVPRKDDDSIVGDRNTDIELQPPHYWNKYQRRFNNHVTPEASSEAQTDVSSMKGWCVEENDEDDSTTNGFVLMVDHEKNRRL